MIRAIPFLVRCAPLAALALLGVALAGPSRADGPSGAARPLDGVAFACISMPSDFRELAFPVRGTVAEVYIAAGDRVATGQPLVRLDDLVQRRTVEMARVVAGDTTPVDAARTSLEFREADLRSLEAASERGSATESELRQRRFELDMAKIRLETARREAEANAVQLAREEARLEQMRILSPIDGTVLDIHKRPGESADEQTKVMTIVHIDPLWLEVSVPTRIAMQITVGQRALVEWEDIDGVEPMPGDVIFKSPAAHGGAREIRVRVRVPNPGGVPSGLHGNVRFLPLDASGPAPPAPTGRTAGKD